MHTRQGVAEPALSQHRPDDHKLDVQQKQFWSDEPLTLWQEFVLRRELDCSSKDANSNGFPFTLPNTDNM